MPNLIINDYSKRNTGLDILRIIACFSIVLVHEIYLKKPVFIEKIFSHGDWGLIASFY